MEKFDIKRAVENLRITGMPQKKTVCFSIENAEAKFRACLEYFCTDRAAVWNNEYMPVVDWLTDNHGKGLLLSGACGTGKTLICRHILPSLLYCECRKLCFQCSATELGKNLADMMTHKLVVIDDVGTENPFLDYGNKSIPFNELVDNAERNGNLLILTTNLDANAIAQKYGERTIDRLRGLTRLVTFTGKSMRR